MPEDSPDPPDETAFLAEMEIPENPVCPARRDRAARLVCLANSDPLEKPASKVFPAPKAYKEIVEFLVNRDFKGPLANPALVCLDQKVCKDIWE